MKKLFFYVLASQLILGSMGVAFADDSASQADLLREAKRVEDTANAGNTRSSDNRKDQLEINPNTFVRPLAPTSGDPKLVVEPAKKAQDATSTVTGESSTPATGKNQGNAQ